MASWVDYFKIWSYSFYGGSLQKLKDTDITGAGTRVADSIGDVRQDGGIWGGTRSSMVRLRDSSELVDFSTVQDRKVRLREYERLQAIPEIDLALTVFANESCVAGDTNIATPFGYIPIEELAQHKSPTEKFLIYCWDFSKNDYTLGWAFHPRMVKTAKTIKLILDNGSIITCTHDHRILKNNTTWAEAGQLKVGDELTPFYRVDANTYINKYKKSLFPRIYTKQDSWKSERDFIAEWKRGKQTPTEERLAKLIKLVADGNTHEGICNVMDRSWPTIIGFIKNHGHFPPEIRWLNERYAKCRRIIAIQEGDEIPVYDMSVDGHENFATDTTVFHNCQLGENNHTFDMKVKNQAVFEELNYLYHKLIRVDRHIWGWAKNLYKSGDWFIELLMDINDPQKGILQIQTLPADTMYRIETVKGRLIEFQQSKEGPDYNSLAKTDVMKSTMSELMQSSAIRFTSQQVVHTKIGEYRNTFYPYGVSLIENARGPAHNLRLMQDAMLTYRLIRSPERKVFYVDVAGIPSFKVEGYMKKMKEAFRKKTVFTSRAINDVNGVEMRWNAQAMDEDFWVPTRPNSNTRIETLPGATALGEVDDVLYFRNQLFTALQFPKNYYSNEDPGATRMTLSQQDVKFARYIERLQLALADALLEIGVRHLKLRGFPEDMFEDLEIIMTPPSDWRESSRNDIVDARFNRAAAVKGAALMADFDILTKILKYDPDEVKHIIDRNSMQKMQELKIQAIGANPEFLGLGSPGGAENELGTEAGGPEGDLTPTGEENPEGGEQQLPPEEGQEGQVQPNNKKRKSNESPLLPEPTEEEIEKYDLGIEQDRYSDEEEVDDNEIED